MSKQGMMLIISGPSGVGKTTIARRVESDLEGQFSVSITSRAKAGTDRPGIDYIFVDEAEFERRRDAGEMLEWAKVFGNYYGTLEKPATEAIKEGKLYILEIDVTGAIQVKQHAPEAYALFVLPPNEKALLDRLRGRQREDEQVIQSRFAQAMVEIDRAKECEVYDRFVVNDDLEVAIDAVIELVSAEWERRRKGLLSRAASAIKRTLPPA